MNHGKNIQERSELDQTMPPPLKSPEPEPPDKKLYSSAKSFLPFQPHFFMAIAFLYMVTAVIEGDHRSTWLLMPVAGVFALIATIKRVRLSRAMHKQLDNPPG